MRELGERRRLHRSDEAGEAEVARMHLQQESGRRADGALVVREPRPVGRADFDDPGAGGSEDLRDAERTADLHQLAPRDDDLAAGGERSERQEQCRRTVVRHPRGLGAGELREQALEPAGAIPPAPGREIELEVTGGGRQPGELRRDVGGQGRAAQVGVQEDSGGVQHPAERRPETRRQAVLEALGEPGKPRRELLLPEPPVRELLPELSQLGAHLGGKRARSV